MRRQLSKATTALLAALALSACGDGGGGGGNEGGDGGPFTQVPPGASASVEGLMDFVRALLAQTSETAEPLPLEGFSAPVSEDAEAQPLG